MKNLNGRKKLGPYYLRNKDMKQAPQGTMAPTGPGKESIAAWKK
jgi:hypothetical protein